MKGGYVSKPLKTAAEARQVVGDAGGGTSPARGEELHDFVRTHGCTRCLELGFANGVGSVYIATALEANGAGKLTSVDIPSALERQPLARELVEAAGLTHRVELVVDPDSYVWWLRRQLREHLQGDRIVPVYDFVFLDGAHTWDTDGLAFAAIDRLVMPGGWVLFDDLDWLPSDRAFSNVPDDTLDVPHIRDIWDLLVCTDPSYDELRLDGAWGYAHKSSTSAPTVRTVVKHDLLGQIRDLSRIVRSKISR
jgi:predicted O-methyltransferase YrrM